MVRINTASSGHTAPLPDGNSQWLVYDGTLTDQQWILDQALQYLMNNVYGADGCNECFQRLSGGRTFDSIIDDENIWISYCPDTHAYGYNNGNDVTVCQRAYSHERSVLMVAGTLVHEFAHVNGAPGTTRQAEATLLACGLGRVYNPIIVGSRETPPSRIG
jgi:hypothetical protein